MTDSKPLSTFTDRHVSRRRLLAIGAAVPAVVVAAKVLPGETASAAPQAAPTTSATGTTSAPTAPAVPVGPASWFC